MDNLKKLLGLPTQSLGQLLGVPEPIEKLGKMFGTTPQMEEKKSTWDFFPGEVVSNIKKARNFLSDITTPKNEQGQPLNREEALKQGIVKAGNFYLDPTGVVGSLEDVSAKTAKNAIKRVAPKAKSIYEKIASKMDDYDHNMLENFIDYARLKKPENVELEIVARKISDAMGINPDVSNKVLANKFAKILDANGAMGNATSMGKIDPKNFKNFDDFLKAQGEKVFRGGDTKFDHTLIKDGGVFVSPSEYMASTFGKNIDELYISPNAKILSYNEVPKQFKDLGWDEAAEKISQYAKQNGYDVVDSLPANVDYPRGMERHVVNPDVLKTKSQLLDIWKKAHGK